MKAYTIQHKKSGGDYRNAYTIEANSIEDAKAIFAAQCWSDLNEGKHGDNFYLLDRSIIEEIEQENPKDFRVQEFTEAGIYFDGYLFMSSSDLEHGIDYFNHDTDHWRIKEAY